MKGAIFGAAAAAGATLLTATAAIIPAVSTSSGTDATSTPALSCMVPGDNTTAAGLDSDQMGNAAAIIATGKGLNVPAKGIVVALATAMQESTLHNLDHGDRDSVGLFQQRAAWGSFADRTTPTTAARMFFTGGHGGQRGLLDVPGWEAMPVWQAAQSVQASAFPTAYAKWEPLGTALAGGVTCDTGTGPLAGTTAGEKAVSAAARYIGTPYSWGGGNYDGPSVGVAQGAGTVGFDCSGLALYAWAQAAGLHLPHLTDLQAQMVTPVPLQQAQAGDLLFFTEDGAAGYPHMGIYDGQGGMIHAPHTGAYVERVPNIATDPYWSAHLALVGRPRATA